MIIESIISQHTEEAAFQWLLRDSALYEPHYDLPDLAKLDDKVEAHIDGLRIAGEAGWGIVKEELAWEEAGEVFTAAMLAFEADNESRIGEVLEVATQSVELGRGAISALGWLTYEQAQPHIPKLIESEEPMRRRIGIAAAAIHRKDPGSALKEAVNNSELLVRTRALRAVGELGRRDLLSAVTANLKAEDESCRFWAAWSATLLGDVSSANVLRELTEAGGPVAERACQLAAMKMGQAEAMQWQKQLAEREQHHRLAIIAAGAIGDPALVPWLIDMMKVEEMARPAGEALTMITGVDIAYEDLEGEWPEGFEAGPTENPEDEEVAMDADEDLPWPDPELITNWWSDNQGRFTAGRRHLLGKPVAFETLREALKSGRQRQRAAAALEMVLLQPGQPLFEVRARGDRQKRALGL